MSLRIYFQRLGLPETASHDEIKKQYRKLAMRLHPDRNPSPKAKEDFLQLTEAYELLIGKKVAPRISRSVSKAGEKSPQDRVKEAKRRIFEQQEKERLENEYYFQSLFRGKKWKVLQISSVFGVVLSVLLICDLVLPRHFETEEIAYYANKINNGGHLVSRNLIVTSKGEEFWLEHMDSKLYNEYPKVQIEKTWFFHNPISVVSDQKIEVVRYPIIFTFQSVYGILLVIFLLPMLIVRYKKRTVWYTLGYQLALYFSTAIMLIYLFSGDRWAHLLTCGFI